MGLKDGATSMPISPRVLHYHDGEARYEDSTGITSATEIVDDGDGRLTLTLSNTLGPGEVIRMAEIDVHGWKRGRFDTVRNGETTNTGRAFGQSLSVDILADEDVTLVLYHDAVRPAAPAVPAASDDNVSMPKTRADALALVQQALLEVRDIEARLVTLRESLSLKN